LTSKAVNGVGTFVPAICKLVLRQNPPRPGAGGDSKGMVEYIHENLRELTKSRPYAQIQVQNYRGPPKVIAFYNNGSNQIINVSRWKKQDIAKAVARVCDTSGSISQKKFPSKVLKGAGSTLDQLLWDPFHADQLFRP
jgi:lysophospholipase L1-like esterase